MDRYDNKQEIVGKSIIQVNRPLINEGDYYCL
jgi:hypothetical protein